MEDGQAVDGSIFVYAPNKGAPVFFAVAFLASTLVHGWQCRHYRSWHLSGLYVVCGAILTAGFAVREAGAFHYDSVGIYIATTCLVYAAPPLLGLANCYVLGRILYYVPHLSPTHPGRVLATLSALASIVEILNGVGAAYSANPTLSHSAQAMGRALLKASMLLQIVGLAALLVLAATFHRRLGAAGLRSARVSGSLPTLCVSTVLLMVRTVYHVVEYWTVADRRVRRDVDTQTLSPLLRYEWFFYVFEASLMLANMALLNARHPSRYLPASTKTYLARDGRSEITGPGYTNRRPLRATLLDLLHGRDSTNQFWDEPGAGSAVVGPEHAKSGASSQPQAKLEARGTHRQSTEAQPKRSLGQTLLGRTLLGRTLLGRAVLHGRPRDNKAKAASRAPADPEAAL